MRTPQFFSHHGVDSNPFAEEDAQTDHVFKSRCVDVRHPVWDKVYGDPTDPATSLVFGEKGSGKTAMRLQITEAIAKHNADHKTNRVWVVEYDDFNPLLDHFADRFSARKQRNPSRVLAEWRLWDHMDGILSIATTELVDRLLEVRERHGSDANKIDIARAHRKLDDTQKRDLMLLAACYDNSTAEPLIDRWRRLRGRLRRGWVRTWGWFSLGVLVTALVLGGIAYGAAWSWLANPWPWVAILCGWTPWLLKLWDRHMCAVGIRRRLRVLRRGVGPLRAVLMSMSDRDLSDQPLPDRNRTDDRYELLGKLQSILGALDVSGLVVLVDRVDEPHLTGGKAEHMRELVWPLLDNKFLKQPGVGLKLLLPAELQDHLNREDREFHQRARIDKQNLVPSLDWSGEALRDLADARLAACAIGPQKPRLRDLIDEAVTDARLLEALRTLRTPRHMFKFLFRVVTTHCNTHSESEPVWKVSPETFEAVLAIYAREQASVDRGLSIG